jgi:hypothetical protein
VGATRETDEPLHTQNGGIASIWYSWIAPADCWVVFDTEGSDFDTALAVYCNATLSILQPQAKNDDNGNVLTSSKVCFRAVSGVRYVIAVDGEHGTRGAVKLSWH